MDVFVGIRDIFDSGDSWIVPLYAEDDVIEFPIYVLKPLQHFPRALPIIVSCSCHGQRECPQLYKLNYSAVMTRASHVPVANEIAPAKSAGCGAPVARRSCPGLLRISLLLGLAPRVKDHEHDRLQHNEQSPWPELGECSAVLAGP